MSLSSGNVCLDSIRLWVPYYEFEGGQDTIDSLVDGYYTSRQMKDGEDEEGNPGVIMQDPERPLGRINLKLDKKYSLGIPSCPDLLLKRETQQLGTRVGHQDQQTEQYPGLTFDITSKHLGPDYLQGINRNNWRKLLRRMEDFLGIKFKSDLLTSRVFSIDIRGDTILDNSLLKGSSLNQLHREHFKLLKHLEICKFESSRGKKHYKGQNWGYTFGKRNQDLWEWRRKPYVQVYSKHYQYLNNSEFQRFVDDNNIDINILNRIIRIEANIGKSDGVKERFGSNEVKDVVLQENSIIYINELLMMLGKHFDLTQSPYTPPPPAMDVTKPDINKNDYIFYRMVEMEVKGRWKQITSFPQTPTQLRRNTKEFWSKESIRTMALDLFAKECPRYFEEAGVDQNYSSGGQKARFKDSFLKAADRVYEKNKERIKWKRSVNLELFDEDELDESLDERLMRIGCYWMTTEYRNSQQTLHEIIGSGDSRIPEDITIQVGEKTLPKKKVKKTPPSIGNKTLKDLVESYQEGEIDFSLHDVDDE